MCGPKLQSAQVRKRVWLREQESENKNALEWLMTKQIMFKHFSN